MQKLQHLLDNNKHWSSEIKQRQPQFFETLSKQQSPEYLWIGCSDSRVPANEIVNLLPGELFVHRNVGNVVVHTDLNCLSVIQYAVDVLKVKHIILCGHYGCGGVRAALQKSRLGLIDNWLRHIQDVHQKHHALVELSGEIEKKVNRLCELNVIEQVQHVCETTIIQDAWARAEDVSVHGWIYGLNNGLVKDLGITVGHTNQLHTAYTQALQKISQGT